MGLDLKLIKARRKDILDSAPCVGCGATKAFCRSQRGKDPEAPEWFGCCARGLSMTPCQHVPDQAALNGLLKEIERGTVRSVEEVLLDSVQEFPARRRRSLRGAVARHLMDDWPDDIPLPGETVRWSR